MSCVYIGKGKNYKKYEHLCEKREEILKEAIGRSGSLRAPALINENRIIIGFNEEMYQNILK